MEPFPTMIEGGCEGCGGWWWDNELVVGVVWKKALVSTTQSMGEGGVAKAWCVKRESQGRCANRATRQQELDHQGGNHSTGENKRPKHVAARLKVELDAVMENRVHGPIKCHEYTPDMLAVVKEDVHSGRGGTGRIQRHRGWGTSVDV